MEREVPVKNYIILSLIILLTVLIAFYLVMIYTKTKSYSSNENVISDFLFQLASDSSLDTTSNIDNYLIDNPNTIIYISSSTDKKIKKFEEQFKEFIINKNLKSDIVYIDTNKTKKDVYDYIVDNYFKEELKEKNLNLDIIPNLIIFDKGKVVNILYNYKTDINIQDIEEFLIKNEVIE